MADIKDKIKKLLSLATSPNENEAKAAMLKAREIMAKNKLSEEDFEDPEDQELKKVVCQDVKWTTDSGKIWMTSLCKLIADNYCCVTSWQSIKGHRTYTLVIAGVGQDADLCREVITYAVKFVENKVKVLQRKYRTQDAKVVQNSYAKGFIMGLDMAYEEQKEDNPEWGLVMVKSEELQSYEDDLGTRSVRTKRTNIDATAMMVGQTDGMNFNPSTAIGTA